MGWLSASPFARTYGKKNMTWGRPVGFNEERGREPEAGHTRKLDTYLVHTLDTIYYKILSLEYGIGLVSTNCDDVIESYATVMGGENADRVISLILIRALSGLLMSAYPLNISKHCPVASNLAILPPTLAVNGELMTYDTSRRASLWTALACYYPKTLTRLLTRLKLDPQRCRLEQSIDLADVENLNDGFSTQRHGGGTTTPGMGLLHTGLPTGIHSAIPF
ncbi:hypothetical protein C8R44DRAFT_730266 [Mycena epipterygia]|nr:hypothetical protein C8R44DRAFT_730266 [Mycena epipterygia]